MKSRCTSWSKALNPPGTVFLSQLHPSHLTLSRQAYEGSVTVVRDKERLLPLSQSMEQTEELLLLTPLVKPLPASTATRAIESNHTGSGNSGIHDKWSHRDRGAIMSGEGVFRELGKSLARARNGKIMHTSYTANGVRPVHENLINRASAIIIVTADANRNLYQSGFTKHVAMMCSMFRAGGQKKSLIVVSVSSPYDFAMDKTIGTYICTFDFTETAMQALVRALYGDFVPNGTLPGTLRKSKKVLKSRQQWLVENYEKGRDRNGLNDLIRAIARASAPNLGFLKTTSALSFEHYSDNVEETHFVVRNSSTKALYGFCATYYINGVGIVGALLVDPTKRNVSIGRSLHRRAMRNLMQKHGITRVQLGTSFPCVFLGIPADDSVALKSWFANSGWDTQFPRRLTNMVVADVGSWTVPTGLLESLKRAEINFQLIHGLNGTEDILDHVRAHSNVEVLELYRFALQEANTCGVVRAKNLLGKILGTIIIPTPGSALSQKVPFLHNATQNELVGGIVAPLVEPNAQAMLVLQGLVMMGLRQNKAHKAARSVLSWVTDELHEPLLGMGFQILQSFEEVTNSLENVSCPPKYSRNSQHTTS